VAGTIAAAGDDNYGVLGVAPQATIMPLKVFSDTGRVTTVWLSDALLYAAQNNADVINNSWGPIGPAPLGDFLVDDAIRAAHALDSVVVFSAGNFGEDIRWYSTASLPETIAVSATDINDERTVWPNGGASNYGLMIDVAAPGTQVLSLSANKGDNQIARALPDNVVGDDHLQINGTSMAAPHVAGVAALIRARHPQFSADEVKHALRISAQDIGADGFDVDTGHGLVRADAALDLDLNRMMGYGLFSHDLIYYTGGLLNIYGYAQGAGFESYKLDYSQDMENWSPIVSSMEPVDIDNGVLAQWDFSLLETGYYYVRLEVTDKLGDRFYHYQTLFMIKKDPRVNEIDPIYYPPGVTMHSVINKKRIAFCDGDTAWYYCFGKVTVKDISDGAATSAIIDIPNQPDIQIIHSLDLVDEHLVWTAAEWGSDLSYEYYNLHTGERLSIPVPATDEYGWGILMPLSVVSMRLETQWSIYLKKTTSTA
jgi:Subtilase family